MQLWTNESPPVPHVGDVSLHDADLRVILLHLGQQPLPLLNTEEDPFNGLVMRVVKERISARRPFFLNLVDRKED